MPVVLRTVSYRSKKKISTMKHRDDWIIIGISGVTCGGKTSLANQLKTKIAPVHLFHQDKYFYQDDSPHHVKCGNLDHNNYDILSALDMEKMYSDICSTIEGVDKAHVSAAESGPEVFRISNKKFLIVEGFTVLNYEPIVKLCNFSKHLASYGMVRLISHNDTRASCAFQLLLRAGVRRVRDAALLPRVRPARHPRLLRDVRVARAPQVPRADREGPPRDDPGRQGAQRARRGAVRPQDRPRAQVGALDSNIPAAFVSRR